MGGAGVDTRFAEYNAAARRAGVATGFYHLFRPDSDGVPQARHFIRSTEGSAEGLYGELLAVDVERVVAPQRELTKAQYADELRAFLEYVDQETNTPVVIYTSAGEWNALVGTQHDTFFGKFPLWVANYTSARNPVLPRCWDNYFLWQYSSSGSIDGVTGRVDLNRTPAKEVPASFTLRLPVDAPARITQVYGANPEYYAQFGLEGHEGVDYGGSDGANIYAAADGTVKLIAKDDGKHPYGSHVRITHADGYESIYGHLRGFVAGLMQGDKVAAGQRIGYMGSTGNSTGTHLHFTLKREGKIIDPTPYFPV